MPKGQNSPGGSARSIARLADSTESASRPGLLRSRPGATASKISVSRLRWAGASDVTTDRTRSSAFCDAAPGHEGQPSLRQASAQIRVRIRPGTSTSAGRPNPSMISASNQRRRDREVVGTRRGGDRAHLEQRPGLARDDVVAAAGWLRTRQAPAAIAGSRGFQLAQSCVHPVEQAFDGGLIAAHGREVGIAEVQCGDRRADDLVHAAGCGRESRVQERVGPWRWWRPARRTRLPDRADRSRSPSSSASRGPGPRASERPRSVAGVATTCSRSASASAYRWDQ